MLCQAACPVSWPMPSLKLVYIRYMKICHCTDAHISADVGLQQCSAIHSTLLCVLPLDMLCMLAAQACFLCTQSVANTQTATFYLSLTNCKMKFDLVPSDPAAQLGKAKL